MGVLKEGICCICNKECKDSFTKYIHAKCAEERWEQKKWDKAKEVANETRN